ncbi:MULTISPECIES: sugar-binding domain-containing protein [Bacillaceae]|uniref:Central glycolytic genes regulator n=1 Tax=Gottfriedia luciferensis TaxID=178774 RepID=A0ABX2ZLA8_9BACI|nr:MULTISPECIES: sugar-binding domain-containing protein [Bacillaceae]ODG90515.1 hypothetical protein BED47_11615 [Gottfriedia luciferensis]PGZ94262.1 hypothetical protein COE53_03550 [Bacillus sp. AFS029533]SFD20969.1 central glycolytic genes regulator [Bacillus sp. UNCCL81]
MNHILKLQQKLLPDLIPVIQKRFQILQYIRIMQPIGRRNLSASVGLTERVLRSEVALLKEQRLINVASSGMTLTDEGLSLLLDLEEPMRELFGLKNIEDLLKETFNLKEVIVVSGDSDELDWVKKEMGRAAVGCINQRIETNNIVAVTGGSTLAAVAEMMNDDSKDLNTLFVPARGGLGEEVRNQANTICAKMAEMAKGNYRLLHLPDELSEEAYITMMEEPRVKEVLNLIRSSSIVVHGIGDAFTMAKRRQSSSEQLEILTESEAVGEAFGYYFNENGEVVYRVRTIGLQLNELENIPYVLGVAGGSSKAKAMASFLKKGHVNILVTDEGAARELIKGCTL